ncbi:MAG: hypothetical protein ACR2GK_03090, partial [Gemmatimonadaceae bacterium]
MSFIPKLVRAKNQISCTGASCRRVGVAQPHLYTDATAEHDSDFLRKKVLEQKQFAGVPSNAGALKSHSRFSVNQLDANLNATTRVLNGSLDDAADVELGYNTVK